MDPVLAGVHYEPATTAPADVGRKAANRNLSDLAAMGGRPLGLLLSLVVASDTSRQDVEQIYLGVESAGAAFDCPIVGGDFASWSKPGQDRCVVTVAVLGECDSPLPRHGVRSGQTLFVTGPLGGSIAGRHLRFRPRIDEGLLLAQQATQIGLSACMDLSDGLSVDLPRMLRDAAAQLETERVPVHSDAKQLHDSLPPIEHALHDGEDYELLFASDRAPEGVESFAIGQVLTPTDSRPAGSVWLRDGDSETRVYPRGWVHGQSAGGGAT
jgi:thiamine-monophosphate kinase